jgi:hypothetical protein
MSADEREAIRQRLPPAHWFPKQSIQVIIDPQADRIDTITMRSRKRKQGGAVFWCWIWPDGSIADWDHDLIYADC